MKFGTPSRLAETLHDAIQAPATYRTLLPDDWSTYKTIRLAALADSPDAFGSTLSVEQNRTPERWRDSLVVAQVSGLSLPLVALVGTRAVGLVWAKVDDANSEIVNVYQMWVAADQRKRGIGTSLMGRVISWARFRNAQSLQLGVTCGDTAAVRMYTALGFEPSGLVEPLRNESPLLAQNMRLILNDRLDSMAYLG